MITKMKKLTFLVYHKEYEEFLNSLRELGVVHIVEKQQGAADNTELQENIRLSNRLTATLKLLQNQKHEKNAVIATEGGTAARGLQVLDEVDMMLFQPCHQERERSDKIIEHLRMIGQQFFLDLAIAMLI